MSQEIGIGELEGFFDDIVEITKKPAAEDTMQEVLDLTKTELNTGFQSGTAPDGSKWPALKHPRPRHRNQNNNPLIGTGKLQESVVGKSQDHLETVSSEGLVLGTYVAYAGVHQNGTTKVPQREFLGFSGQVQNQSAEFVANSLIVKIDNI